MHNGLLNLQWTVKPVHHELLANPRFYQADEIRVCPEGCLECGSDIMIAGRYAMWCLGCWDVRFLRG